MKNTFLSSFLDTFLESFTIQLSKRLSKQLQIEEEIIKKCLEDENYIYTPLSDTSLSDTTLSDTPLSDTPLSDTPLSDTPLNNSIKFIYDFKDKTIQKNELFWKNKAIKIDNKKYRLHIETNLVFDVKEDILCLVGLISEKDFYEKHELPLYILEWCKLHSIK